MNDAQKFMVDKGCAEHAPDLYSPDHEAPVLAGVEAVDQEQLGFYREHGYLAVADVFSPERIDEAQKAIADMVCGRNEAFNAGLRKPGNGMLIFEASARDRIERLQGQERLDQVRRLAYCVQHDPRLDGMAHDPVLLGVVSKLLGGAEPELYQDMMLLKPPKIGREKPWHQDHAYFNLELDDRAVGVWIALDEATMDNGCMQVLDGGHRQGPILHFNRRDFQICDTEMLGRRSVACPLKPGGALFFDSLLPHGTPTNHSPLRRQAMQFHYCRKSAPRISTERRLERFGAEGKDVTC